MRKTRSELGTFMMEHGYNEIAGAITKYAFGNKNSIPCLSDGAFFEQDDTTIHFKFAHKVAIVGDKITFCAGIEASFVIAGNKWNNYEEKEESESFRISCEMRITDKLEYFKVLSVEVETYNKSQKEQIQGAATDDFVPVIPREQYESEAEAFLKVYCPEALTKVMQVPMRDIVERRMGLKVVDDVQLTKDLAVFGQICFNNSTIKTYNPDTDAYVDTKVERGTIFIDPNTNFLRCVGCGYNTLAHEAFHWWKHRVYATVRGILRKENHISYRCPTAPSRIHTTRATPSDTDWMEIQANAIAPKILMPRTQTETKVKQLVAFFGYNDGTSDYDTMRRIIDELADFYSVSKQAAKIRMIELGYHEAAEVYNYDVDCFYTSHEITEADAFHEAQTNEDFKALIDMELFRFAEGYFVINTDKYAMQGESGEYRLTDYARENLAVCALNFRYDALDLVFALNRESGVMYKQSRTPRPVTIFTPEYNEELVSKALDEVPAALKSFDDAKALGNETVAQILARYMKQKKWNSSTFQTRTGLKSGHYSKTNTNPNRVYELPILVSICVGLDLPHGVSREILEKAGFKLNPAILEQSLYDYILSPAGMRNIPACNEFLQKAAEQRKEKVRPLGSGFYDGGGKDY